MLSLLSPQALAQSSTGNSSSVINAQLCIGGVHAPSGSITLPAPGTIVGQATQNLTITTSWVTSYDIYRGSTLLASNLSVSYAPNVTTYRNVTLSQGNNPLYLVLYGGCPSTSVQSSTTTLTYSPNSATIKPLVTNVRSPLLRGFVSHPAAVVTVHINGKTYTAQNNGDGTWTLPTGTISPELADGEYAVRVVATVDGEVISDILTQNAVTIDTSPPTGGLTTENSDSRSPELNGTVNDAQATVTVTINGQTYSAVNNGDGTWTLPAGVINSLASGTYDVLVTITDRAGNVSTYTYQIVIKAANELGFLLAPNTGFLRIGTLSIPSWLLYSLASSLLLLACFLIVRKQLCIREAKKTTAS